MTDNAEREQPDKLVQECFGYTVPRGLCAFAFVFHGVLPLLSSLKPRLAIQLLRKCPLHQADWVLVKLIDSRLRLVKVYKLRQARAAVKDVFCLDEQEVHAFKLFLRLYTFDPQQHSFQPVPAMPRHLPHQIAKAISALRAIETAGAPWKVFNVFHREKRRAMVQLYGVKKRLLTHGPVMESKDFIPLLLIQALELGYLVYQHRWFYPVLCGLLNVFVIVIFIRFKRAQQRRVMNLLNVTRVVPIVGNGYVHAISSHRLVPGDVIVLQRGKATCDMVLLRGACLVVEATLSGEASQVRKVAYVPDEAAQYQPDRDSASTIYAGTTVQQVWNSEDAQDEVLVMVVRTGFNTTMGSMVRELVAPTKPFRGRSLVVQDILLLYLFALAVHMVILLPYDIMAEIRHETARGAVLKVLNIVVYAAPPGVPTIMVTNGIMARRRLGYEGITLMYPEYLATAADLDMVCFDKTGTLTRRSAELHGVLPVDYGCFSTLQHSAIHWSDTLKQAAAVCHSLTMVNKSTAAGVDVERSLFKAVEAHFLERNIITLPKTGRGYSHKRMTELTVVKVFEFSSQTLRSGVVVLANDGPRNTARLFIRGAPAVIQNLVEPSSLPPDFDQVMDDYSTRSFRLIAMAAGILHDVDQLDLLSMSQQAIEAAAVDLELLSLVVLANSIREDSVATIKELQEAGGLKTLIVTGDYHHTALAVAKQTGMVQPQTDFVIVDSCKKAQIRTELSSLDRAAEERNACIEPKVCDGLTASPELSQEGSVLELDDDVVKLAATLSHRKSDLRSLRARLVNLERTPDDQALVTGLRFVSGENNQELEQSQAVASLAEGRAQCAITGAAFELLLQQHDLSLLEIVMRNVVVFARMQPHQKGEVMDLVTKRGVHQMTPTGSRYIPGLGKTAMFCGDGINDLAALSAADVGMAIGATDATIAAVVITKQASIAGTVSFIKSGKSAHAMLLAVFKYLVVYQFIVAQASVAVFCMDGSTLSHLQVGVIDFQAMTMAIAALYVMPLPHMTRHKPPARMCHRPGLLLLAIMALCLYACLTWNMVFMASHSWYHQGTPEQRKEHVMTWAWTIADISLLGPLVSLTIDTRLFCQSIWRSKPLLVLVLVYNVVAYVLLTTKPVKHLNPLNLSDEFPRSFRMESLGIVIAGVFAYALAVNGSRRLLLHLDRHKIQPLQ